MIIIILIIIVIVFIVISRIHTVKANSDGIKKKILQVFRGYLVVWKPQDNHKIKQARIYGGLGGLTPPPPLGGPPPPKKKGKKEKKKKKKKEKRTHAGEKPFQVQILWEDIQLISGADLRGGG